MNFTGHIELEDWRGQPILTVRDYELLDFLEDHFIEQLDVETSQMHSSSSPPVYQILFPTGTSTAAVWRALEAIGPEEIERIVAINSGAGSAEHGAQQFVQADAASRRGLTQALGPLLSIAAKVVDHLLARVLFAVLGLVVAALFVLFGVDFVRVDPATETGSFSIGVCALLGQAGWWARVLCSSALLRTRFALRVVVVLLLLAGIASVHYALAFMPKGPLALPLLFTLLGSGVLMLLATVEQHGPGPNNSSKPTPLRGAA